MAFVPATALHPVVIIGAPRSGTNMLRDALVKIPGFGTWPCDEINYIWRHGNLHYPSDEFPAEFARPKVRRFILDQFGRLAARIGAQHVVEKTCANTLRLGFVEAILPDARYVYIRRDPFDAIASTIRRWQAPLDVRYVLRKARFVPPFDIPYYAVRYAANRFRKVISSDGRLASWGPRFEGLEELLETHSLPEVCAYQWQRCVRSAEVGFSAIPPERVCEINYELFVANPQGELLRILAFLGTSANKAVIGNAVGAVRATRVGGGASELGVALDAVKVIVRGQ